LFDSAAIGFGKSEVGKRLDIAVDYKVDNGSINDVIFTDSHDFAGVDMPINVTKYARFPDLDVYPTSEGTHFVMRSRLHNDDGLICDRMKATLCFWNW
jgi:hypothetical protein